ncbi:MAG: hypothetical protein JSR37_02115 [Verrucomicrobia bacterium]|nr:hypothetical protein [Verrucomicrobiota bacterium]MBS0638036.1 hypothetical protein [Verrucomicrobiota bacterium]
MKTATLARIRLLYTAAEQLIGPLLVFIIAYAHNIYFASDYVSSFFAVFSLVSLLLVMAVDKTGILLAIGVQLAFLGWIAVKEPTNLLEQMLFSSSISLSLIASYINTPSLNTPNVDVPNIPARAPEPVVTVEKDKHWQELFTARQEITSLYQQKNELEARVATLTANQKLLEQHLEVAAIEKKQFVEDRAQCEEDLKKFGNHMQEMALYQETLRQEILRLEERKVTVAEPDAMFKQLKSQFDEKSKTLDETRRELFSAQEEIAILQKTIDENLEPTAEERRLMQELVAKEQAHEEELLGYEGVIQGLLNQLQEKHTQEKQTK